MDSQPRGIDHNSPKNNTAHVEQNRRVMVVAVKAIKYLAKEMMALRGHESDSGKFMQIFKLLVEFVPSTLHILKTGKHTDSRNLQET